MVTRESFDQNSRAMAGHRFAQQTKGDSKVDFRFLTLLALHELRRFSY